MLLVSVVCSLVFIVELLGLIKFCLYMKSRVKTYSGRHSIGNSGVPSSEADYELENKLSFQPNFDSFCVCACYGKLVFGS